MMENFHFTPQAVIAFYVIGTMFVSMIIFVTIDEIRARKKNK